MMVATAGGQINCFKVLRAALRIVVFDGEGTSVIVADQSSAPSVADFNSVITLFPRCFEVDVILNIVRLKIFI